MICSAATSSSRRGSRRTREAGEILVSSTLKQYTETDPSFEFEPRGEHHFKGLLGEHTVYGVRWR